MSWYANALHDKSETDPMAVRGVDGCRRRKREGSEEPASKHQISMGVENGRTDAGRDGMTELVSRDRSLRREREQEKILFPAQRTTEQGCQKK